jgi:RNA polymerase-binding protein DksA
MLDDNASEPRRVDDPRRARAAAASRSSVVPRVSGPPTATNKSADAGGRSTDDEGGTEMSQYEQIHDQLLAKQAELTRRLERLKENLTAGRSADSQEQAQELENAEVVDALGNEARTEISKIAKALDQIKNETYGICGDCGETIPMARLTAQPFADRCIRCATAAESGRKRR